MNPIVSVISPVYNVSKFIERCAESLMKQTLEDVEFIFVNDATPDNSIEILNTVINRYPNRIPNVKIITHNQNKGLPAARNTGLSVAVGDYIFHCDSDDFVESDMLERMYKAAMENDADIVWCDYYLSFEKKEKKMSQPSYDTPIDALKGMLHGKMKYNVWNKLVRRELYVSHHVEFPAGYSMGEDLTMMKLFLHAKKISYLPDAFYHYIQFNSNSITAKYSDNHLKALYHNLTWIADYLMEESSEDLSLEIACLKLDMKWPFLLNGDRDMFEKWQEWFPEANSFIWSNKQISKRICLVEWMASKKQFWFVLIHYWIVCRLYYGIVYR